jgi:hypothetical protein
MQSEDYIDFGTGLALIWWTLWMMIIIFVVS